ncbi:Metallo-dependent phosphatase [Neocallimastix sp. 'constans']|jgi:2',3'-cyclic-nucleotide 2'-phosphodiesterase (5'-nucleotidase family)
MKSFIYSLTLIIFFFGLISGKVPDKDIIILYTNDVHCGISGSIGYAGLAYYRNELITKKTPYVALVDSGDHVQGGAVGTISEGDYIIDIMNAIGYDVATPGNHEFDYGMEKFNSFVKNLSCGYISCNFRNIETGKLVLPSYQILEFGDIKVGFVGISTPESIIKSTPTYFMNAEGEFIYDFDGDYDYNDDENRTPSKFYETIQEAVDSVRAEGVDYVIALGHLGESVGIKEWGALEVVAHTTGIDAFIDGHSHEVTPCLIQKNRNGENVPITQSGTKLRYVGQVTIGTDGQIKTELIGSDQITSKDEKINELVEKIELTLNDKVTEIDIDLVIADKNGKQLIRNHETNLANLITDAYLDEAKEFGGADIALCNGGSIRAPIKAGNVSFGNIMDTMPFNDNSCIVEMPGQAIMDSLEMSIRYYPVESGGFLHFSGLTFTLDPEVESSVEVDSRNMFSSVAGERRAKNILVNGKPIDPEKKYRVVGDTYTLVDNGDGHVFNNSTVINSYLSTSNEILITYIKKLSQEDFERYREPQGRIIIASSSIQTEKEEPTTTISEESTQTLFDNDSESENESDNEIEIETVGGDDIIEVESDNE